jgi:hypothetical protein
LIYLLIFRLYDQFKDYWSASRPINDDIIVSRGLLLDICPFCAFVISIAVIIDPTRKIAKIIAPFALFGGLITILGGIGDEMNNI